MLRRTLILLTAVLLAACGRGPSPESGSPVRLTIACAASLRPAIDDAAAAIQKVHPDITIVPTYGASGTFFAQLTQRAPFDLFLSADTDYPRKLVAAVYAESDFIFASGRLALWVPKDSPLDPDKDGLQCLTAPSLQKLAVANPRLAPYGRAAAEALAHAGLTDAVKDKLVLAENVSQAAQFAQSGAAQAGLIALSLTLTPEMQAAGKAWTVPPEAHQPLEHSGVILPWTSHRAAAERCRDWLLAPDGAAIFDKHGFTAPRHQGK